MKLGKWLWLLKWRITTKLKKSKEAATLGVMPDYGYKGNGMRIGSVSQGKTAEKYQLKAGDIVTCIDNHLVEDLMSYMSAMARYHVGDRVNLQLQRDASDVSVEVEFK